LALIQECGDIRYKRLTGTVFPKEWAELYENFSDIIRFRVSGNTLKSYRSCLKVSADFLVSQNITDINDIDGNLVAAFTMTLSRFIGSVSNRMLNLFAELLLYAYEQGLTDEDKSRYCMKVEFFKHEKIPHTFTKIEIEKTLAVIDRNGAKGKRDYAMLKLASRTGLRTCDIINLKLENLRFDTDTIEISQKKTGKMLTLPLVEEVGVALIDYLRDGRPETDHDTIFLRHKAPHKPLGSSGVSCMIRRYMDQAGIDNYDKREPGLRAFRHSLAGNMLENNVSIQKIQNVLDHESLNTTMRYVKIDTSKLKYCALEVPPVGS